MYCSQCGKELPNNCMFCIFCGVKLQKNTIKNNYLSVTDLIIAACKDCVEKHLKAPITAKYHSIEIKEQDNYGRIYLLVEVDAQNGFGAYIRSKLRVILQCVNYDGTYEATKNAVYAVNVFNTEEVVKSLNKWNKRKK